MTPAILTLHAGSAVRRVDLASYVREDETAVTGARDWIKRLRHAQVDGLPLRRRFAYREDSLWWFAELYLHKERVVLDLFRTIAALDAVLDREQPSAIGVAEGSRLVRSIVPRFAAARGVRFSGVERSLPSAPRLAALDARSTWLQAAAFASRLRRRPLPAAAGATVLAFVHRAFWRAETDDGGAEQYIGPVLKALADRLPRGGLTCVSIGPSENFRARRWWHPVVGDASGGAAIPIETFASLETLWPSSRVWRERHVLRRALWRSDNLRTLAQIRGCDCWPIVRDELAGIALLQWPWSARAMDEAGAALDAIGPRTALTYAEAGGWGRAIVLECRRRGIPSAGLQHGFIHRHWLNYLHEPDEMASDPESSGDAGFPHPSLTLLFDAYAARHLTDEGHFPENALRVTGSARLDDLVSTARGLSADDLARARRQAGAAGSDALVIVTTKWREAREVLPRFLLAASTLPDVHVAIKTHPAETPDLYDAAVLGLPHVTILPATSALAPLLAGARAVVTVNSTVALDAAVLGVPSLVLGLPNNLSPFVDAGIMAGAGNGDDAEVLWRILYDEGFRQRLEAARRAFLSHFRIRADGLAAERSARAVLQLADGPAPLTPGR